MGTISSVLHWWVLLFGIGVLVFPLTRILFHRFWDRGWALSKVLGLALLSYWVWIVGSLRILPFTPLTLWIGIGLLAWLSFLVGTRQNKAISSLLDGCFRLVLFEELLFGFGLLFWAWIRAHQPDINGLEKFMDFGFLNSILRSRFFPPLDMWLSGQTINYYYFGHLVAAVMTKLSGLSSTITYNLMIASIFSLSLVAAFSLGGTLTRSLLPLHQTKLHQIFLFLGAVISALTLTFAGNLHTIITVLTKGTSTYWYPDATRYIPYTIHEFPIYSFVVADLHGHVSNIPFVLFTIGILLTIILESIGKRDWLHSLSLFIRLVAIGFFAAILYMTNAWDAPIYLLLFLSLILCVGMPLSSFKPGFSFLIFSVGVVFSSALVFSLPFHLRFHPFASGVAFVSAHSSLSQLLVLWGFFLFVGLVFLISLILHHRLRFPSNLSFRPLASRFVLTLMVVALLLVVVPELIYIKDIYVAEYHRANTMFKLVYQTFIIMSLVTGPVFSGFLWILWISRSARVRLSLVWIFLVLIFGLASVLYYPVFAIRSYYNSLKQIRGLDGLVWLSEKYPDDYAAVSWLRHNLEGQPVMLEAVGESYTEFARVSANTGLPTVLGWRVHEWLWRGSFSEPGLRTNVVSTLYTTPDFSQACKLVETYGVDYVFIGTLERQQYPTLSETKFQRLGNVVFASGNTKIYRIRRPCGGISSVSFSLDFI